MRGVYSSSDRRGSGTAVDSDDDRVLQLIVVIRYVIEGDTEGGCVAEMYVYAIIRQSAQRAGSFIPLASHLRPQRTRLLSYA